jgi:hypothetical protein
MRVFSECVASISALSKTPAYPWPNKNFASVSCCDMASSLWNADHSAFRFYQRGGPYSIRPLDMPEYARVPAFSMPVGQCSDAFTTLCDGIPRAMCPLSASTAVYTFEVPYSLFGQPVTTRPKLFPIKPPSCNIDIFDCSRLVWEAQQSAQEETNFLANVQDRGGLRLGCSVPPFYREPSVLFKNYSISGTKISSEYILSTDLNLTAIPFSARTHCNMCVPEFHDDVQVDILFWKRDFDQSFVCSDNKSHPIASVQSYTATYSGNIIVYPTPYAFFSTYSVNGCGTPVYNVALPLLSGDPRTLGTEALNRTDGRTRAFAKQLTPEHWNVMTVNINNTIRTYPLVPWSAYSAQKRVIFKSIVKTINNDYVEMIVYYIDTRNLRTVDGQWQYCNASKFEMQWIDPPVWLTPAPLADLPDAIPDSQTGSQSTPVAVTSSHIEPPTIVPVPGNSLDPPYPLPTSFPPATPSLGILTQGSRVEAKLTLHTMPVPEISSFFENRGSQFLHSVLDINEAGQSASYDSVTNQWVYTETNAIFSIHDAGLVMASQVRPGVYAVEGTTFSQGGAAINFHGAVVTAYDSGVIVLDGAQRVSVGEGSNTFLTLSGTGRLEVSQVQSGVFVIDGTTSSKGGSATSFQGSIITIDESGVIIKGSDSQGSTTTSKSRKKGGGAALCANWSLLILALSFSLISS